LFTYEVITGAPVGEAGWWITTSLLGSDHPLARGDPERPDELRRLDAGRHRVAVDADVQRAARQALDDVQVGAGRALRRRREDGRRGRHGDRQEQRNHPSKYRTTNSR
jgi:hypothetical protein